MANESRIRDSHQDANCDLLIKSIHKAEQHEHWDKKVLEIMKGHPNVTKYSNFLQLDKNHMALDTPQN